METHADVRRAGRLSALTVAWNTLVGSGAVAGLDVHRAPVEVTRPGLGEGRAGAVVNHAARALVRAGLEVVDPQPLSAPADVPRVDAEPAELRQRRVAHRIGWERGDEGRIETPLRQGDRDVALRAAERRLERG